MTLLPYYLVGGSESLLPNVAVSDIQSRFVQRIQSYLPRNPVKWVSLEEVQRGLTTQCNNARHVLGDNTFFVTLSKLYYTNAEGEVSCTRLVDSEYQSLGLSNRPNTRLLKTQVLRVMRKAGDRPIAVVDDTLFHGDTITFLQKLGLRVDAAVEFFSAKEAVEKFESRGIEVFSACSLDDYLDVMPLHDFLPGMPLCGKLIGTKMRGNVRYLGYNNGNFWSLPYLYPFIPRPLVNKWASIPWEFVYDFSAFALQQTTILADRLKSQGVETLLQLANFQDNHVCTPYMNGNCSTDTLHDILQRAVHHCMVSA